MTKKIKSFTVDEDAYNSLVRIFKESGADVSVSLFVNNCLKELSVILADVAEELAEPAKFSVPMSFIIKSLVESNDILGIGRNIPEDFQDAGFVSLLVGWQEEYEARQSGIPVEFVPLIKTGLYNLSPDRYLIERATGMRYISGGKGKLIPVNNPKTKLKTIKKPMEKVND